MGLRLLGDRTTIPAGEPLVGSGPSGHVRFLPLPRISDPRGNLTFIESGRHVPFECRRIFYLYDVPGGEERGGHAHRDLQQVVIAVSGSFDVSVDDGSATCSYQLNRSYNGLYLPPMVWAQLTNFSSGSVALVLASEHYEEADYFRDYADFTRAARAVG